MTFYTTRNKGNRFQSISYKHSPKSVEIGEEKHKIYMGTQRIQNTNLQT